MSTPRRETWLLPYSGLMMVLLALFIALLVLANGGAKSNGAKLGAQAKNQKPEQAEAPHSKKGAATLEELEAELADAIKLLDDPSSVSLEASKKGLWIKVRLTEFFPTGSARIHADLYPILDRMVKPILESGFPIQVQGHADSYEAKMQNAAYDSSWGLSTERAVAVVEVLSSKYHVPATLMSATGLASAHPIGDPQKADDRTKSRRVEFLVEADKP